MYAIVKTGGKQYKVAAGDVIAIERLAAQPGDTVTLDVICTVDGDKVEAVASKAAATKVEATVLEEFRGPKQLVFKFNKRKNYKKLQGHRQNLMKVRIDSVGGEKAPKQAQKKAEEPVAEVAADAPEAAEE